MIAKRIQHGGREMAGDFSRLCGRILTKGRRRARLERVRITNCASRDPAWVVREVEATQALAPPARSGRTYWLLVSLRPGERPGLMQIDEIEDALLAAVGFADHQRICALYDDGRRLMATCAELEVRYGLERDHRGGVFPAGRVRTL